MFYYNMYIKIMYSSIPFKIFVLFSYLFSPVLFTFPSMRFLSTLLRHSVTLLGLPFLCLGQLLNTTLSQLGTLSFFVCFPTLEDTLNNLTSIYMLEVMCVSLSEYAHSLRCSIRVICQGNERCWAMVNSVRNTQWKILQIGLSGGKGCRKDDGVDILNSSS